MRITKIILASLFLLIFGAAFYYLLTFAGGTRGSDNLSAVSPAVAGEISQPDDAVKKKPKSVIVIDICSLRKDHIGGFGYDRDTTPNIDAFMKESAVFENFWTQSSWCLPNFATMFTGQRPSDHKQIIKKSSPSYEPLADSTATLAEIFNNAGFETALFSGSIYLTDRYDSIRKGFDVAENLYMPSADNVFSTHMATFEGNLPKVKTWLSGAKDKPFFLYVTIDDLHAPYHSDNPKIFDPNYKGILDEFEPTVEFGRAYNEGNYNQDDAMSRAVEEFKKDPKHLYNLIARYDAAVLRVDRLYGELISEIKKEGLWDESLIIVTAHQGELLGEHNLLGHTEGLYEPILSVPLFIKYPGFNGGKKIEQLSERIDIPATILDSFGMLADYENQFIGASLAPLIFGETSFEKKYISSESKPVNINPDEKDIEEYAVRNERYKLVWHKYNTAQPFELYDLRNDPKEEKNLISELPEIAEELKAQLPSYIDWR